MKIYFKKIAGLALAVLTVLAYGCSRPSADGAEAVVRIDGKDAITLAEYQGALKRLITGRSSEAEVAELKKDLIGRLVEEELIIAEAKKAGLSVAESDLSSEVDGLKAEYGEAAFKEAIAERYGGLENWKEEIRRKILIRKAIETLPVKKRGVSEKEARRYFSEHSGDYSSAVKVRARMIVVGSEESAQAVRKRLTPANFADIASEVSLSPEGKRGGDLGFFGPGEMPKEFEDVVFRLKLKEISKIIKTEYGYHIFLLEEKKRGGRLKFEEAKGRIMERLKADASEAAFEEWVSNLKKTSRVEIREDLL